MTRSLSGGVLAGRDEPLMVGLGFPTSYSEHLRQWGRGVAPFFLCPQTRVLHQFVFGGRQHYENAGGNSGDAATT